MEHQERIDVTERNVDAAADAVAAGPLDAAVATCPGMTVDGLAAHLGQVCAFWTHVLAEAADRPKTPYSEEVGPEGRAEWLHALGHHLVAALRRTGPDTPVWTYYPPDQTAGFVARRTCHEIAVHRVDLQLVRGEADPITPEVAVDGIDEILDVLVPTRPDLAERLAGATGRTLHLHGTDTDGAEWLLTLAPEGVGVTREHAKGDLALRGATADLEMLLFQRPTWGEVQRFGDETVLDELHRIFTF